MPPARTRGKNRPRLPKTNGRGRPVERELTRRAPEEAGTRKTGESAERAVAEVDAGAGAGRFVAAPGGKGGAGTEIEVVATTNKAGMPTKRNANPRS